MKRTVVVGLAFIGGFLQAVADVKSNHLNQFELYQCESGTCVRASGDKAFVSMANDSIAASDVRLSIRSDERTSSREFDCQVFSYDLVTGLLVCDNEDNFSTSFTIDRNHVMRSWRTWATKTNPK